MSDPTNPTATQIQNDPHFVPLAVDGNTLLKTENNEFIIVSSTLRAGSLRSRSWLKSPPHYVKGQP